MRIAMIHTPFWNRSGGERQILKLAIGLQQRGHEVEIFTNAVNEKTYPELFDKVKLNVIPHPFVGKLPVAWTPHMIPSKFELTAHQLGVGPAWKRWIERMRKRWLLQQYVRTLPAMFELGRKIPKRFDIINNHNFPTEWAGFIAKNRLKIPLIWMCNEPPYWHFARDKTRFNSINWPLFELLDKTAVQYIDDIMVLSKVSAEYVRMAYNMSSKIVRTGVDADLFHNATGKELRKRHNLENTFVCLFVGGSVYAKRSNLIRAIAILAKKHRTVRLIIDTMREREMLAKLSEELGVKEKVLLLNSTSDSELAEVYAACDVFVYPSSASPWGLVVTEAMAAGKPVIVSKQVGTSEIIQDHFNGIVIDRATPEEIAQQIELLMDDPKLSKRLGENAYKYIKENLSWEKYSETVEGVFTRMLLPK